MEIKTSIVNRRVPVYVVSVSGKADSSTREAFLAKADEVINNGAQYVLADLSDVSYISSAGLFVIHHLYTRLRDKSPYLSEEETQKRMSAGTYKSPYLKLLNLSKQAQEAFKLGGFYIYIETFTDFETAVASF